jgi:indolepyruvate ferredoxin oxidoreductase, alpha subunit
MNDVILNLRINELNKIPENKYMKNLGDFLLSASPIDEIVIGNTSIVRAMIESGVRVVTAYPGSPTPEIANAIKSIPKDKRPFYFEYSVNEKVATEVAAGASVNGHTSVVFFKSVGLNVAADSFVQLSLFDLEGGMVIVLGDDPGANSSQNEQDNRHFAYLSYMPVFEPANPQEVYTQFLEAVAQARSRKMPVIFRMTTHVCHAKQKVSFGAWANPEYDYTPKFDASKEIFIPITHRALTMKHRALQKLSSFEEFAETTALNFEVKHNSERGIIAMGASYLSLLDVLDEANYKPDILKLGIVYPFPKKKVLEFLKTHKEVKILEELDDLLEKDIKSLAYDHQIHCKIIGKQTHEDWIGEYTADKVYEVLRNTWPDILPKLKLVPEPLHKPGERLPQLCPGCGHRAVFTAVANTLSKEDITVADIGCHTLGFQPPYNMGQVLLSMGHSPATASGMALFNTSRKVVAFLGDSTFYHAAMPAIVNAVFNRHNITLIILPNDTTGMTGHQDHAGTGHNFDDNVEAIPIRQVLEGLGVKNIRVTDAYNQKIVEKHLRESLDEEGLSVIIASHPCMLRQTRIEKKAGTFKNRKVQITDACTMLQTCITKFACPSFQRTPEGKITVHTDLCIGDASCIQVCDDKAIKFK